VINPTFDSPKDINKQTTINVNADKQLISRISLSQILKINKYTFLTQIFLYIK